MGNLRALVLMLVVFLLFGCSGGGCQNDSQCKLGQACVKGACVTTCARESQWCDKDNDCCSGMRCNSNACRFPRVAGEKEPHPVINATNGTASNQTKINMTIPELPKFFQPRVLDLAEGQKGSAGGLSVELAEVTENLVGCSVGNEKARIKVSGGGKSDEFVLGAGENMKFANADIAVLNIPCIISENESGCSFSDVYSEIKIESRNTSESIIRKGQQFLLPDDFTLAEAVEITDLGPIQGYSRAVRLSEGESISLQYPYKSWFNTLDIKVEGIDETSGKAPEGAVCRITSKQVRLKTKTSGFPENQAGAPERGSISLQGITINVQNITGSLLLSDGLSCVAVNKSVLLNISFPAAQRDLQVIMLLYVQEGAVQISSKGTAPFDSEKFTLEVSPPEQSSGIGNTFRLKAVSKETRTTKLSAGESSEFEGISASAESFSTSAVSFGGGCVPVDVSAQVKVSEGSQVIRRTLREGEVISLSTGSARLVRFGYGLSKGVSSCKVVLERALIAVSPIASQDSPPKATPPANSSKGLK